MAETIDELSIEWTDDDGTVTLKQTDKQVLTKGSWTTIMYRYQDWDRQKEVYGPEKATIRRYRKRNGRYSEQSKFNISSAKQARRMVEILSGWFPPED